MPDRTITLDVIQIQSPCGASWDAMAGDDVMRFCGDCQLHVHNLSEMRRRDAEALVQQVGRADAPRVCVQMQRGPDGRIVTRDDRRWSRRLHRRAAYVGVRLIVGLGTASVMLLGATGVLASRESELIQKIQQWRPTIGRTPVVAGGLQPAPPVPGQIEVMPVPPGEDIRIGEMQAIMGDIAEPAPPPPQIRGLIAIPPASPEAQGGSSPPSAM